MTKNQKRKAKLKKINPIFWKLPISYKVPFDREGNLPFDPVNVCHFSEDGRYIENNQTYRWKENFEFEDTLKYESCIKTKSVLFNFRSVTTGCTYSMFLIDFLNLIKSHDFKKGVVKSKWTFQKIGKFYGIVAVSIKRTRATYKNKGIPVSSGKYVSQRKAQPESSVV